MPEIDKISVANKNGQVVTYTIKGTGEVGNGRITLTQGGVTKGSFTTNQAGDATIALDAGGSETVAALDFDNVAAMKASDKLTEGVYTHTGGYYTVGDGGGALYRIVSAGEIVDGGSIIALDNGLNAKLIAEENTANVKQFGAKGDGSTDDRGAIANAIKFADTVYFPKGTYNVSSSIALRSNLRLIGLEGAVLKSTNTVFTLYSNQTTKYSNVEIRGLSFINVNVNEGTAIYAVMMKRVDNITFVACKTDKCGLIKVDTDLDTSGNSTTYDAYYAAFGDDLNKLSNNISVMDCTLHGHDNLKLFNFFNPDGLVNTVSGIYIAYANDVKIHNCTISWFEHGISLWGGNVGQGQYNVKDMPKYCNNVLVDSCYIHHIRMGAQWVSRGRNNQVNNCVMEYAYDTGVDFEGSDRCSGANNILLDCRLVTMFGAYDIRWDNNIVIADELSAGELFVAQQQNEIASITATISVEGNTFVSTDKFRNISLSAMYGTGSVIKFANNTFENVAIFNNLTSRPKFIFTNNVFYGKNAYLAEYNRVGIIEFNPTFIPRGLDCEISNNDIRFETKIDGHAANDAALDGKCGIRLRGAQWGEMAKGIVANNTILGFTHSIRNDHEPTDSDTRSSYTFLCKNNLVSGDITAPGTRAYLYLKDNLTALNAENPDGKYSLNSFNPYPYAVPTSGTWKVGQRIDFVKPDADGYTGAICTVEGTPGTWKRIGKTE